MENLIDTNSSNDGVSIEVIPALPTQQAGYPESDYTDSGVASLPRMTTQKEKRKIIKNKEKGIQKIRFAVQTLFALLCIWIGVEFYQFLQYLETNGVVSFTSRPPGVDGFLPISSDKNPTGHNQLQNAFPNTIETRTIAKKIKNPAGCAE